MEALPLLILGLIVLAIYVVIRLTTNFSAWMTGARSSGVSAACGKVPRAVRDAGAI